MSLRGRLRKLWTDHVLWTRLAIVSVHHGLPDLKPTLDRLLRNQDQIGSLFVPSHGIEAGKKVAGLLRVHIKIAAELLSALKAKKPTEAIMRRWEENADEIAVALAALAPALPAVELRTMLRDHLKLTTREALARGAGDYQADIAAFDAALVQALRMADMMAAALDERA